jgi:hypothetical protein
VTFSDNRSPGVPGKSIAGKSIVVMLKHGRLTVSKDDAGVSEPLEYLRNRHIQEMHLLLSGSARLRVELSDMCVDLFDELSVAELVWVKNSIECELRQHRRRKESAMAKESVPERWRYAGPRYPTCQETKALLILMALLPCLLGSILCLRELSQLFSAIDGLPIDADIKLRLLVWVSATFATFVLITQLALALFRSHEVEQPKERASLH